MNVDFKRPLTGDECETAFICVVGVFLVLVVVVAALLGWPGEAQGCEEGTCWQTECSWNYECGGQCYCAPVEYCRPPACPGVCVLK